MTHDLTELASRIAGHLGPFHFITKDERDTVVTALRAAAVQGEPVAYQYLVDGEWKECSEFVAKGWSVELSPDTRALYTAPPPAAGWDEKPTAWIFPRRYGFGVQFPKPTDCTDHDGNPCESEPLYRKSAFRSSQPISDAGGGVPDHGGADAGVGEGEPIAFMFWNEPDTQRHFTQLKETIGSHWSRVQPLYAKSAPVEADPLDDLVARFSVALLKKLKLAQANGRSGWEQDDWEADCQSGLLRHVEKGDPRDVAAYCAFMWHHGWITKPAPVDANASAEARLREDAERYRWLRDPTTDVSLVLDKRTGESPRGLHGEFRGYDYEYRAGEELDTAIDNARALSPDPHASDCAKQGEQ